MTERETLAAEHALRLLEGEELMNAHRLMAEDPSFGDEVRWWEEQIAPLSEELGERPVSADLWPRIVARLETYAGGKVIELRRRLRQWRVGAIAAAVAAAVLLGIQLRPQAPLPQPAPQRPVASPILLASLTATETADALTVAYRPESRELIVTPGRIAAPAERVRELWLIPAGAQPISLGTVDAAGVRRRTLDAPLAARFEAGAIVALSDEPLGGSPTGQPTGAVLATGTVATI